MWYICIYVEKGTGHCDRDFRKTCTGPGSMEKSFVPWRISAIAISYKKNLINLRNLVATTCALISVPNLGVWAHCIVQLDSINVSWRICLFPHCSIHIQQIAFASAMQAGTVVSWWRRFKMCSAALYNWRFRWLDEVHLNASFRSYDIQRYNTLVFALHNSSEGGMSKAPHTWSRNLSAVGCLQRIARNP